MAIFNWIQARFAHGTDHVTDAPGELAEAIAGAVRDRSERRDDCDFGVLPLANAEQSCIYLRVSRSPGGLPFVHVVAWDGDARDLDPGAVERIFARRYGDPPHQCARELMTRIASLSAAEATLPLAERFVEVDDLGSPVTKRAGRSRRGRGLRDGFGRTLGPWVGAAAVAALVGLAARPPLVPSASVDAPPPDLELERRVARLESERSVPEPSLRMQLLKERERHERLLAEKDREIAELTRRLERTWTKAGAEPSVASDPTTSPEGEPKSEVTLSEPIAPPPFVDVAPTADPIAEPETSFARVIADVLWVRAAPGTEYRRLAALDWDTSVEVEGSLDDPWTRLRTPIDGWVASEFLELESDAASADPGLRGSADMAIRTSADPAWER